ncbi:MAG: hypothetical protein H8E57_02410 [Candidatus Cloacimonetes bacterium]|nr:hypothetical protein [Candidatus Cloacimonadota bacterium]
MKKLSRKKILINFFKVSNLIPTFSNLINEIFGRRSFLSFEERIKVR